MVYHHREKVHKDTVPDDTSLSTLDTSVPTRRPRRATPRVTRPKRREIEVGRILPQLWRLYFSPFVDPRILHISSRKGCSNELIISKRPRDNSLSFWLLKSCHYIGTKLVSPDWTLRYIRSTSPVDSDTRLVETEELDSTTHCRPWKTNDVLGKQKCSEKIWVLRTTLGSLQVSTERSVSRQK